MGRSCHKPECYFKPVIWQRSVCGMWAFCNYACDGCNRLGGMCLTWLRCQWVIKRKKKEKFKTHKTQFSTSEFCHQANYSCPSTSPEWFKYKRLFSNGITWKSELDGGQLLLKPVTYASKSGVFEKKKRVFKYLNCLLVLKQLLQLPTADRVGKHAKSSPSWI